MILNNCTFIQRRPFRNSIREADAFCAIRLSVIAKPIFALDNIQIVIYRKGNTICFTYAPYHKKPICNLHKNML